MFHCSEGHELSLVFEFDLSPITPTGDVVCGKGKALYIVCRSCGIIQPLPINWSYDEENLKISTV